MAYAQKPPKNTHPEVSSGRMGLEILSFGLSLRLYPYFVYGSREGQASLHKCVDSPELSLLDNVISTKMCWLKCIFYFFNINCSHIYVQ